MKKVIRLTESDLHRIVKKSVKRIMNEAYGTPDAQTQQDADFRRRHLGVYPDGNGIDTSLDKIYYGEICNALSKLKDEAENGRIGKPYFGDAIIQAIDGFQNKMEDIFRRLKKQNVQDTGEQPDPTYFDRYADPRTKYKKEYYN